MQGSNKRTRSNNTNNNSDSSAGSSSKQSSSNNSTNRNASNNSRRQPARKNPRTNGNGHNSAITAATNNKNLKTIYELNDKGLYFNENGEYELAVECFTKGLQMMNQMDNHTELESILHFNRANSLYLRDCEAKTNENHQNIIDDFTKAIELGTLAANEDGNASATGNGNNNNGNSIVCKALLNRGAYYYDREELDLALKDFEQALQLQQQNCRATRRSKRLKKTQGRKTFYNLASAYHDLGLRHVDNNNIEEAIKCFTKSIQYREECVSEYPIDPDQDSCIYYNRAFAYELLGDHEASIADYTHFLDLIAPRRYIPALYNRAWAYDQRGEFKHALNDLDEIVNELDPEDIDALYYRGVMYHVMGRWREAMSDYERVLKFDPQYETAAVNLEELKKKHMPTTALVALKDDQQQQQQQQQQVGGCNPNKLSSSAAMMTTRIN